MKTLTDYFTLEYEEIDRLCSLHADRGDSVAADFYFRMLQVMDMHRERLTRPSNAESGDE